MRLAFKPMGKDWATETAQQSSRSAPRRTGKLAGSFKVKSATQRDAKVVAIFYGAVRQPGHQAAHHPGQERAVTHL